MADHIVYYITNVFAMAGYSGDANLLASSIQYIINVIMTLPALVWMDRWGRRPTLLVGATLMAIWMYANAGIMATYGTVVEGGVDNVAAQSMEVKGPPSKALIACTYLFVAYVPRLSDLPAVLILFRRSYAPTWGPVSWVYPPELFPLHLRGKGVSLSTSGNWAFNTALGLFTPEAFANIKWRTYLIFGIFNTAMFFHVLFLFPETAGKTLEETEAMFEDPDGFPYIGTPAWKTRTSTHKVAQMEQGHVGDLEAKAVPGSAGPGVGQESGSSSEPGNGSGSGNGDGAKTKAG